MNDFQTLTKMLDGKVEYRNLSQKEIDYYKKQVLGDRAVVIGVEVQNGDIGYSGFTGIWLFGVNGSLITVGHYE